MTGLIRRIDGTGPARLAVALCVYFSVLAVLRLTLFPGGSDDDAEILFYTQSWSLAYKGNQPPLYAWIILAVQSFAGPAMWVVIAVKYGLLALFYGFSYLAARRLFADHLFAVFAPLSLVACFFIGWDTVVNYSHTVLLLTAMAATMWLLLRLEKSSTWVDYAWVALAIATGLLAKYNFVVYLLPLLIGAWRHPGLRPRVFCLRFAATMLVAISLAAVPLAGFLLNPQVVEGAIAAGRLFPVVDDRMMAALSGLGQFALSSLGVVSPFLPLAVLFFPRALAPLPHPEKSLINAGRFLEAYLLALLILSVAVILASGAADVRNNWLVVWFPLPLYLLLRIKVFTDAASPPQARRITWFAAVLIAVVVVVPVALAARGVLAPQSCRKCNFFIPYAELADSLKRAGFAGGTLVAKDRPNQLAGNLRRYFPKVRAISTRWRDYHPPLSERAAGQCLVLWPGDGGQGGEARALAESLLGSALPDETSLNRVTLPIQRSNGQRKTWTFLIVDGSGRCR